MSNIVHETSDQAETAFYSAFEGANVEAMMAVWSADQADELVCIHPHGPRLVGYDEIRDSWEQILKNSPPIRLRISQRRVVESGPLSIHYVNEHIHVGKEEEPQFTILATNVYRLTERGWRMILHHASPTPEALQQADADPDDTDPEAPDITLH